ncbi:MAG: hypothetical protein Q9219_000282 [cf. Caloplaca sp. 3 TL-2023]
MDCSTASSDSKPAVGDNKLREPCAGTARAVTWYQQLFPGARDRQLLQDGKDDVSGAAQELRQRIAELEEEVKELRNDSLHSSGSQDSQVEPLLKQLSDEDREKLRLALQQTQLMEAENAEVEVESDLLARKAVGELAGGFGSDILREIELDELEAALHLEPHQKASFRRFHTCLGKAASNAANPKARKDLWTSYERCKRLIPSFLQHMTGQNWDTLWRSQHAGPSAPRGRGSHLSTLAQDILRSGKDLSMEQRANIIDTLIDERRLDEAQKQWDLLPALDSKGATSGHRLQGVRLFASRGDLDKAQEIAETLCKAPDTDPNTVHCFILLIEEWTKRGGEYDIRNAWSAYLRLRQALGTSIKIDDFDKVAMCFINAGRTSIALAVFKDMMLTGRESECGSGQFYRTSLTLVGLLQSRSASSSEVINVSLNALTTLPRKFQNKFFYGSWIKKLIGLGEINAAVSVIELMYERSVTPDAKHVNGIIGAWLRSGQPENGAKAEQLGWAMIQQRLKAIDQRHTDHSESPTHAEAGTHERVPPWIQRIVPSATIETFSLLLLHYERRGNSEAVHALKRSLDQAKIPPNSYFMNHILYAELRRGGHGMVWRTYQAMKDTVKPDLETFACLWDCEKAYLDKFTVQAANEFPDSRRIFREHIRWYEGLGTREQAAVRQEFSEELYNQIIRCMCLAKDLEGTIVALYGLRKSFEFLPNDKTLRMIPLQAARIGLAEPEPRMNRKGRRSRLSELAGNKERIANVSRVLDLVVEQRMETLNHEGIKLEDCSTERQNEEQIYILADFLQVVMRRYAQDEQAVKDAIKLAAEEMGVPGIGIGYLSFPTS